MPFQNRIDFNRDWEFVRSNAEAPKAFLDEQKPMIPVILPHIWNPEDRGVWRPEATTGKGWYRKTFQPPTLQPGQRLFIELEGVGECFRLWVNNGYAGGRIGGFIGTWLDITDFLNPEGENTILCWADNSYNVLTAIPKMIGWGSFGGCHRPVWLHVRDHAYIDYCGVEIRTPEVSETKGRVVAKTHIQEARQGGTELEIRHTILSPEGKELATASAPLKTRYYNTTNIEVELPGIANPRLWSLEDPALHTLRTELIENGKVIDTSGDRFGFRFFKFDVDEGFSLNGKPVKLIGVDSHVFYPGLGNAVPERYHYEEMKQIKEMGGNFFRTAHYPRPQCLFDACDELGILVMEEQPYWHGAVQVEFGEEAIDNIPRMMQDMVRQHGNHPSIVVWNTVNELCLAADPLIYPYARRHVQKMIDALKEADPSRPVSVVTGAAWQVNDDSGLTSMADIVAYNGGAVNDIYQIFLKDLTEGRNFNYREEPYVGPKTGKTYAFRPDYYRELYPDRIHILSEGIICDPETMIDRGNWAAEEKAWRINALYWDRMYERPWFCGGAMWALHDTVSPWGATDIYHLPKEFYYFYAAMGNRQPVLHILGHWNHEAGSTRDIVVFTNCEDAQLTLNGKSLGPGHSTADEFRFMPNPPRIWKDITFEPGVLRVTGTHGTKKLADQRITTGPASKIRLTASPGRIMADGRDTSYIDFTICDADGNRCYTWSGDIAVTVSGAAWLPGTTQINAKGGLARIAIRSNGDRGKIACTAKAEGLQEGTLSLLAE